MEKNEIKKIIKDLEISIKKLENKKNKVMFFVADSKGAPIGSLTYIYGIAYQLKEMGYNVQMLYAENEFVGVGGWLGEKYALLPHYNVTKDILDVSPSDILFIPELYGSIMAKTKTLHCKKIAILENFGYMTELIPFGATWESMGIHDCITTSEALKTRLNEVFPNIRTYVIRPVIDNLFFDKANEHKLKNLIVNIVSKDERYINSIVKPFKWRHPEYGFVTFRYINGKPRDEFAKYVTEGEITVWIDSETDFGYSALEAMACGNIIVGKIPENEPEWMLEDGGDLKKNGIWFYNMRELPDVLANVIGALIHNSIPEQLLTEAESTLSNYTQEKQNTDIVRVFEETILNERKNELTLTKKAFKDKLEKTKDE